MFVDNIYQNRPGKKGAQRVGMSLAYFNTASVDKYLPTSLPQDTTSIAISLYCNPALTAAPLTTEVTEISFGDYVRYLVEVESAAGCSVYDAKDPYWMFEIWNSRVICGTITVLTGIIISLAGKYLWKFVHFATGFGLLMTIFLIVLYPAYVRQGYRMSWPMWICYPLVPMFSAAFGFFLQHYPRGGCFWLGGWLAFLISSNLVYNVIFNWVPNSHIFFFWAFTIPAIVAMLYFLLKTTEWTKEDKTYHLLWQAPIFGGYLCGLSLGIFASDSPHTRDFAEVKTVLGPDYHAGMAYLWAIIVWIVMAAVGFASHKLLMPRIWPAIEARFKLKNLETETEDTEE